MRILFALFGIALTGLVWALAAAAYHVRKARSAEPEAAAPVTQTTEPISVPYAAVRKTGAGQARPLETFF